MALQLATIEGIKVEQRISSNGRNLGQMLAFNTQGTPAQMRALYKAAGLTGNKLSAAVRDAQKAEKDIAWVKFHALSQMAQNDDFIPTTCKLNTKNDKMTFELALPKEEKPKKAISASDEGKKLALAALLSTGMTKEQAEKALRAAGAM